MKKQSLILSLALLLLVKNSLVCAASITVPSNQHNVLSLHAKGEQIYQCVSQQGEYSWQLQRPNAQLYDATGQLVGSHSAGPEWTYQDGSHIKGQLVEKIDVTPDSAVAWLLLKAIEPKGKGLLTTIRFIQRINTQGGLPPVSSCDGNHLGTEKSVSYSADYIFYTDK